MKYIMCPKCHNLALAKCDDKNLYICDECAAELYQTYGLNGPYLEDIDNKSICEDCANYDPSAYRDSCTKHQTPHFCKCDYYKDWLTD